MANKEEKIIETAEMKFGKEQILSSKKYEYRRDALGVILEDGKEYSFKEVDELLDGFMKGKVN